MTPLGRRVSILSSKTKTEKPDESFAVQGKSRGRAAQMTPPGRAGWRRLPGVFLASLTALLLGACGFGAAPESDPTADPATETR